MKNLQAGFAIPIIIAVMALLAVGGGVFVYTSNKVEAPASVPDIIDNVPPVTSDDIIGKPPATTTPTIPTTPITTPTEPVFCTMDAMECPDGSWVGRTGPNCEFVCPGTVKNVFSVPELGIKFKTTPDLNDLMYSIEDISGTKYAKFTSSSLLEKHQISTADEGDCSFGALGSVSLYRKGDGLYISTGSYERPHDRCSVNKEVEALQFKLVSSLESALKTAVRIEE